MQRADGSRRGLRVLGSVAWLVLVVACGGDDSDAGAEADAGTDAGNATPDDAGLLAGRDPVPPEKFLRAMAMAVCQAADVCEPDPYIRKLRDDGDCVEAMERGIGVSFAPLVASARFGEIPYDAMAVRACLDSFVGKCPLAFDLLVNGIQPITWCPGAFRSCPLPSKEEWQPPLEEGEACLPSGRACVPGVRCSLASLKCEACADGDGRTECELLPAAVELFDELLLVDRPKGASCETADALGACNSGLTCIVLSGTCEAPRRAGEACPAGEECAGSCQDGVCAPVCP